MRFHDYVLAACVSSASAFPSFLAPALHARGEQRSVDDLHYRSLAGLSEVEVERFARTARQAIVGASPAPGPLSDTSSQQVQTSAHPYVAPSSTDQRGPCPGLNTLANHGYLNHTGIVSPQDIVNAVQQGFNMGNDLAIMVGWGAMLVDGNQLTNLMSIGAKANQSTGPDPPAPALDAGLDTHGLFEGDASTTRGDYYFGDNHSYNETLFQVLVSKAQKYGGGQYNRSAASETRWARLQDSMARNPTFQFLTPRYYTAYAETIFPYVFFVDGRNGNNGSLDLGVARGFFQNGQMPTGFYRRSGSYGLQSISGDLGYLMQAHPLKPGYNTAAGHYVNDPNDPSLTQGFCAIYTKHVNVTVPSIYPNPQGALRTALKANLNTFYSAFTNVGCKQLYPYGQ